MAVILVFGASIAQGYWDTEGGWVVRLKNSFDKKSIADSKFPNPDFYAEVFNLGISGDTTSDILKRFEFETKQRLDPNDETIFIFEGSVNDFAYSKIKDDYLVSPEQASANIKKLIDLAKKFSKKIVFIGLTPAVESKTNPVPWNTDIFYNNKDILKYDNIIKSICKENKIPFIPLLDEFMKRDYKNLLEDGLHPNAKGHKFISDIVNNFLKKNKII